MNVLVIVSWREGALRRRVWMLTLVIVLAVHLDAAGDDVTAPGRTGGGVLPRLTDTQLRQSRIDDRVMARQHYGAT